MARGMVRPGSSTSSPGAYACDGETVVRCSGSRWEPWTDCDALGRFCRFSDGGGVVPDSAECVECLARISSW